MRRRAEPALGHAACRHTVCCGGWAAVACAVSVLVFVGSVHAVSGDGTDTAIREAAVQGDGTACYNDCSGHGVCVDYQCQCDVGFHGEDCRTSFVQGGAEAVAILAAGHYRITSCANVTRAGRRAKVLMLGFSSPSCDRCVSFETEYRAAEAGLAAMGVDFARVDASQCHDVASELGVEDLPTVVVYRKRRARLYNGPHTHHALVAYAAKQLAPPTRQLHTELEFAQFLAYPGGDDLEVNAECFVVIAVVRSVDDFEDELEEFQDAALQLVDKADLYFGFTDNAHVQRRLRELGLFTGSPLLLLAPRTIPHVDADGNKQAISTSLAARFAELTRPGVTTALVNDLPGGQSIAEWTLKNALPLVGQLTPQTFPMYAATGLPMLMLFLDLTDFDEHTRRGGRSGKWANEELLALMTGVADTYRARITFVFVDGIKFADRMRSVGLSGGKSALPGLAFNLMDSRVLPYDASRGITTKSMSRFCNEFLAGKLTPLDPSVAMEAAEAGHVKPAAPERKGVMELFHAEDEDIVTPLSPANWASVALSRAKDVLVLFHSIDSSDSMAIAPYFKKMARQFKSLELPSLVVARYDITSALPPHEVSIERLPTIVFIPAFDKSPPFKYYSGVAKVGPMMRWVSANSGIQLDLPHMPQFTDEERELFKVQIAARQRHIAAQRTSTGDASRQQEAGGAGGKRKGKRKRKGKGKRKKKGKGRKAGKRR